MRQTLLLAHDENVTPGWACLVLSTVLGMSQGEAVALVMELHAQGWVDVSERTDDVGRTAVRLASLGLDARLSEDGS